VALNLRVIVSADPRDTARLSQSVHRARRDRTFHDTLRRMGISPYLATIRAAIGSQLLILPAVTGIVFDERRRVLLVQQRDVGLWSTPGGAIEPNETPADAVVREVWEETGLYTDPVRLLGVFGGPECTVVYANGDQVAYVTTVFECRARSGTLSGSTDETSASRFFGASDLETLDMTRWSRFIVPKLLDGGVDRSFQAPSWRPSSAPGAEPSAG
jgi:8-oxo-dGTP diphosphatase